MKQINNLTIDVKTFFDMYGNTYFSARVTVNQYENEENYKIYYRYGNSRYAEDTVVPELLKENDFEFRTPLSIYCRENKIPFHVSSSEGKCRDMKAWGK